MKIARVDPKSALHTANARTRYPAADVASICHLSDATWRRCGQTLLQMARLKCGQLDATRYLLVAGLACDAQWSSRRQQT